MNEKENVRYPRHESDRADELIDELDEKQIKQLYNKFKTIDYADWLSWLEKERKEISLYDCLNAKERKNKLIKANDSTYLLLHHACMYLELWRMFLTKQYLPLPPNGVPIDTPDIQREFMLASVASFNDLDIKCIWPFEHEDIDPADIFPFK